MAHQIVFHNASDQSVALYFTVLGEPPLKMLRYQQQFEFFDPYKLARAVQFVNLSDELLQHGIGKVYERIVSEMEQVQPSIVVVDSFRPLVRLGESGAQLQEFLQLLALHLTSWQATSFLVAEYAEDDASGSSIFTVADGIVWLYQQVEESSMVQRDKMLAVIYLRPLDLSVDEALLQVAEQVQRVGATRVVVDSVSGFELALAPPFRRDFRESLHRMVVALTSQGITVLMTVEVVESYHELRFTPHEIAFLADDLVLQRYVEMHGALHKVIGVIKMRRSDHAKALRAYEITDRGIVVGESLANYRGVLFGVPELGRATRA
jgi:KaiC/GvpD/RAD55 family RecA-like ATPase